MSTPRRPPVRVSRRGALVALGTLVGGVSAACTDSGAPREQASPGERGTPGDRGTSPAGEPPPASDLDPDLDVLAAALAGERAMVAALEASTARHRTLRAALAPVTASHREHVRLLSGAAPGSSAGTRGAVADEPGENDGGGARGAQGGAFRVPERAEGTLAALAARERAVAGAGRQRALDARSGPFARVLASMSASALQQAALLATSAPQRSRAPVGASP